MFEPYPPLRIGREEKQPLASQSPPYDDGEYYYDDQYGYPYHRRGVSLRGILLIGLFMVMSFYLALLSWTPLLSIVAPGNEKFFPVVQDVIPGVIVDQPDSAETIDQRINVLFMGLDRRIDEPEDQPYRTDSIMVMTIDPYSKTMGAFSIPRDTVVEIPSASGGIYTTTRINEAYELGEYLMPGGYPGGGPQLAKDTVELNFGIPIDHYILMDWGDFIDIVDALGGIDVTIPEYAFDPAYTICSFCGEVYPVEFLPGTEHMDGERALAYARIRKSDNDYKRIERQQIVLRAMAAKAASTEAILNNPIGLYNQFKDAVETDISDGRAPGLALLAKQSGVDSLVTVSMAPATFPCSWCNFAGLEFDPDKVEELKALVFSDSRILTEAATVEVLNGTPVPSLASDFASQLRAIGIPSERISIDEYADGLIYDTTLVVDRTGGNEHTLDQIKETLGLPDRQVVSASDPQAAPFLDSLSDIVIILGQDVEIDDFSGDLTVGSPGPIS